LFLIYELKRFKEIRRKRPKAYLGNLRASIKENPVKVIIEEGPLNYP